MSRKLNRDQKRARKSAMLATFAQRYARKAQRSTDPNDRRYDRQVEIEVKRTPPEEFDRLLRDDEEER